MMKTEDKDIIFVAKRYKKGCFSTDNGWKRLGVGSSWNWRRIRVAAAVAVVVLSATAAIIYHDFVANEVQEQVLIDSECSALNAVMVIDFDNAPLAEVVEKIESVYGVKVENIPADSEEYRLSLHYEGTPGELIEIINEILGTKMTIAER
ncbi:MAG: FecR domain-containing protein [Muribaculaceae bacterium]